MKANWDLVIVGKRVVLVPYRECYVERYHGWMQDEALLAATASERLTLEEERANQKSWRDDEAKLTFIVLAREGCFGRERFPASAMVGDVNMFVDRDDGAAGEVEVMVAETKFRRRGLGREAVELLLGYASRVVGTRRFFAKIGEANAASLALFRERLGFVDCGYAEAFKEVEVELRLDAPLALGGTAHAYEDAGSGFRCDQFGVAHDDGVYACAVVLFGAKAAFCWVGRVGAAPDLGALCCSGPRPFEHAMPAVTSLLDDGDAVGPPMAQRLSKRCGRVVLVAWSLGDAEEMGAARVEHELAKALPPRGCGFPLRLDGAPVASVEAALFGRPPSGARRGATARAASCAAARTCALKRPRLTRRRELRSKMKLIPRCR